VWGTNRGDFQQYRDGKRRRPKVRKHRILVVDDEPRYLHAIEANLRASAYFVITAQNGMEALDLAASQDVHLVLLDAKMPGMDGYLVCKRLREFSHVPIIMLTELAQEYDNVKGLRLGADDYVTKPFSTTELIARVEAVLRRAAVDEHPLCTPSFRYGDLYVDFVQRRVYVRGHEVSLSGIEYRLLCELARGTGRVLTPGHLLHSVWGDGYEGENALVWQAVHRLRRKIEEDPDHPQLIHTRPGIGYVFSAR
jgi:DNA-binding response OmpR family regulator